MSYGRPPPNTEGMTSLKVDNVSYRTSMETLKRTFERYGEVGDVYIPRDVHRGESRGFAFVRYYSKDEAEDAIEGLDGKVLEGRELRVQMAKYARPSNDSRSRRGPPRRYSGGGGGGGSYRGGRYGRSRSRSPDYRRRDRSYSRSKSRSRSRSPRQKNNRRYSRSASRSKSRSPVTRTSKSRSPVRRTSKSRSKSRSRSRS